MIVLWKLLDAPPNLLLDGYDIIVSYLNRFIKWVASHDSFIAKGITLSWLEVILIYIIIVLSVMALQSKKTKFLYPLFTSTMILVGSSKYSKRVFASERFIVFHKSRQSLFAYEQEQNLTIVTSASTDQLFQEYPIKSYKVQRKIKNFRRNKTEYIYTYKNEIILTIDSLGVYDVPMKVDVVLLTESPRINFCLLYTSPSPRD